MLERVERLGEVLEKKHMTYDPVLFSEAFDKWFEKCKALYRSGGRDKLNYTLSYKFGRKYIKIISFTGNQHGAWAFVEMETGNILKPASWKAPAKGVRGNIFDKYGGMKFISWTGPYYLESIKSVEKEEEAWEGWDDPSNYKDIHPSELMEARMTRKDLEKNLHERF